MLVRYTSSPSYSMVEVKGVCVWHWIIRQLLSDVSKRWKSIATTNTDCLLTQHTTTADNILRAAIVCRSLQEHARFCLMSFWIDSEIPKNYNSEMHIFYNKCVVLYNFWIQVHLDFFLSIKKMSGWYNCPDIIIKEPH